MRVLVLTSTYPRWQNDTEPGFVHELNKRLAETEEIITLAPGYPGAAKEEILDGVKVIRYNYFLNNLQKLCYDGGILPNIKAKKWKILLVPFLLLFMSIAIVKAQRKYQFDLIHCHWIIPQGIIFAATSKLLRIKIPAIVTSHGGDLFSLKNKLFEVMKIKSISRFDKLLVVSEAMKKSAIELGIESQKIIIQPMGVDLTETFTPPPAEADRQGIIFVGRLVSKKGVEYLIKAFPKIVEHSPKTTLIVIGDGPLKQHLINLTIQLKLEQAVTFLGSRNQLEVRDYLRSTKIAVFPSVITKSGDQEGLGLTIIEALGCGCEVFTTKLPGINDIFLADNRLHLLENLQPTTIFNRIRSYITEQPANNMNAKLGISQSNLAKYDWKQVTKNHVKTYKLSI